MKVIALQAFDPEAFLGSSGIRRRIVEFKPKPIFLPQGDIADCVYYLRKGRAKVTVVSNEGKEATITFLSLRRLHRGGVARFSRSNSSDPATALTAAQHSELSAMK